VYICKHIQKVTTIIMIIKFIIWPLFQVY